MNIMPNAPTLQSLVDEVVARVPALSLAVLNETHDELKDKPQYHQLFAGWLRERPRFIGDFESSLRPLLAAAREGKDPLQRSAPVRLDTLSLVDEKQALQDVAIAHVVSVIEDRSKPELHQLGNFFAALRGIARPLKNDNPLRPALFAQALNRAMQGVDMDPEGRYALMRVAAQPLANAVHTIYGALCQQLREADLINMVASHGAGIKASEQRQRQFANTHATALPTSLDSLARRVDELNSRPQRLGMRLPTQPPAASGGDLLSRLYGQILADPNLLPMVKQLLARLQVAVARLAQTDGSLLRRADHPTWQLLNRVSAHGQAFENPNDERLREFLSFMDAQVQQLVAAPVPTALQFQQTLNAVDQQIRQHASQRSERSAVALAALEREQQRGDWLKLLREQLKEQLADAPLTASLRKFLLSTWVEVIVQAMVLHGRDAPEALAYIGLVDELLDSLQLPATEAQRDQFRSRLPGLVSRMEQGMASIAMDASKRQAIMTELMQQHGRILRGLPALAEATPSRPAKAGQELSPEELLQQLLTERESQLPSHWAHSQVDRGHLPTVPVSLYAGQDEDKARVALEAWMDQLQIGNWYHLFLQSQWMTAQIAWISESRQFFLFVGQDADERHSLTRGAIEQLLANGLITALEEESLVQRAVTTLMQDLDAHS
ncbi:DUF1631 family protein [Paucibacter soli]|uniref:DUF1631 family protein n=1 Tax=Paucibacter soli TaxID=3133433 RepID=UPI0030B21C47